MLCMRVNVVYACIVLVASCAFICAIVTKFDLYLMKYCNVLYSGFYDTECTKA